MRRSVVSVAAALMVAGCGPSSSSSRASDVGASPTLAAPAHRLFATVRFAKPVGWPAGRTPTAASG